jgi:LytS/YehU family sensor histidine kinase
VTAAFALTLLPGFRRSHGSLLAARDRGSALLVFLVLGLVEEASGARTPWLNERIVTVCAAGLVAGPSVGLVVSVFVTWLAVFYDGLPIGPIGFSMLCGGLIGGGLNYWPAKDRRASPDGVLLDSDCVVPSGRVDPAQRGRYLAANGNSH